MAGFFMETPSMTPGGSQPRHRLAHADHADHRHQHLGRRGAAFHLADRLVVQLLTWDRRRPPHGASARASWEALKGNYHLGVPQIMGSFAVV